ncbi:MAG: N4-gp56 family major capsid protein [Candidatus Odinarchaeia archaeon]
MSNYRKNLTVEMADKDISKVINEMATGTTSSSDFGSNQAGERWFAEVLYRAEEQMMFAQFAMRQDVESGEKTVYLPIENADLSFTDTTTEGSERTMTKIDNLTMVPLSPSLHRAGVEISKTAVAQSAVPLAAMARRKLAWWAAQIVDQAIVTAIAGESSPAATLYGGDATGTDSLEAGDIFTPELIADAIIELEEEGWPSPGQSPDYQYVLFIHPKQKKPLIKDGQFVNASEYGNNEVVMNGEIGKYLGVKVVVSVNCTAAADWGAGNNLKGHKSFLCISPIAYGLAYHKDMLPSLVTQYKPDEATHKIMMDVGYASDSLQGQAIVIINTLDA